VEGLGGRLEVGRVLRGMGRLTSLEVEVVLGLLGLRLGLGLGLKLRSELLVLELLELVLLGLGLGLRFPDFLGLFPLTTFSATPLTPL
jgi:hypothetical protein